MPQKIRCLDIPGEYTEEVVAELNERLEEFGITRDNLISISVSPTANPISLNTVKGSVMSKLNVAVFYWSD